MEAIRKAYERLGPDEFYRQHGATYRNPHEASLRQALAQAVHAWQPDLAQVLDLACGSGEVTLLLRELGSPAVTGIDPYTGAAYQERTGQAARPLSFEQIAAGALAGEQYSLIVCSFALHLVALSRLPLLLYHLAQLAPHLLIVTPHKRPHIAPGWHWALHGELLIERVRVRLYARATSPGEFQGLV
ncbi:MAG: methyltransferase domain-containing protein [Anaerolineae bacterium]|jgi:SAM-dependent methyltransferase|nr:methyltransferase domain-containing protein [Anaerolineae bacterium]